MLNKLNSIQSDGRSGTSNKHYSKNSNFRLLIGSIHCWTLSFLIVDCSASFQSCSFTLLMTELFIYWAAHRFEQIISVPDSPIWNCFMRFDVCIRNMCRRIMMIKTHRVWKFASINCILNSIWKWDQARNIEKKE